MKHRRSSFSAACPAARVLLAVALAGVAACSASPGDDGGTAPGPLDEEVAVAGANASAGNAGAGVERSQSGGETVAAGGGVSSSVHAGGSGSLTEQPDASDGPSAAGTAGAGNTDVQANAGESQSADDSTGSSGGGADGIDTNGAGTDDTDATGEDATSEPSGNPDSADGAVALEAGVLQTQVVTLAEGAFATLSVAAGNVYVVDRDAAVLARVSTEGGALEPISPTLQVLPHRLAVDASGIHAALFQRPGRTELWRLPVDGGDFDATSGGVFLGEVRSVATLGVNAGGVVSLEARPTPSTVTRTISRASETGGVVPVGTVDLLFSDALALDESAAYVIRGAEGVSDIVRVDLTSSETSSLVNSAPDETLRDLALAAGNLYFASTTRVGHVSATTDAAQANTLANTAGYRLVANTDQVYFLTSANGSCSNGSKLYRVAATGGTAEHLASEASPGCITSLAADAEGIYWLTADGSQLRALATR